MNRREARVLVIGAGGLGCPALLTLARAGIGSLGLCDDDVVERTNLHRQILFDDGDVGSPKLDAVARALRAIAPDVHLRLHRTRLLPRTALALVREYDMVLEGSDNFATKFLAADACMLARIPIVHASAVRWIGTALAVGVAGAPCYRCLFEDLPPDGAPNCAEAGVVGPAVGVVAAAQVDLALGFVDGRPVQGQLVAFDGRRDVLRRRAVRARLDCSLCGQDASIRSIDEARYTSPLGYVENVAPASAG
jgi:molybdopterin/thiamine biosynthesis adenylyltransferase